MTRKNRWGGFFGVVALTLTAGTGSLQAQEDEVRAAIDQIFEK